MRDLRRVFTLKGISFPVLSSHRVNSFRLLLLLCHFNYILSNKQLTNCCTCSNDNILTLDKARKWAENLISALQAQMVDDKEKQVINPRSKNRIRFDEFQPRCSWCYERNSENVNSPPQNCWQEKHGSECVRQKLGQWTLDSKRFSDFNVNHIFTYFT